MSNTHLVDRYRAGITEANVEQFDALVDDIPELYEFFNPRPLGARGFKTPIQVDEILINFCIDVVGKNVLPCLERGVSTYTILVRILCLHHRQHKRPDKPGTMHFTDLMAKYFTDDAVLANLNIKDSMFKFTRLSFLIHSYIKKIEIEEITQSMIEAVDADEEILKSLT